MNNASYDCEKDPTSSFCDIPSVTRMLRARNWKTDEEKARRKQLQQHLDYLRFRNGLQPVLREATSNN